MTLKNISFEQEFSQDLIEQLLPSDDEQLKELYKAVYNNMVTEEQQIDINQLTEIVTIAIKSLESYRQQHGKAAGFGAPGTEITSDIMEKWCDWCITEERIEEAQKFFDDKNKGSSN